MERTYNGLTVSDVVYFVGQEIEHTDQYGKPTLFVVGPRPTEEILHYVKQAADFYERPVTHVFLTANQSMGMWKLTDEQIIKDLLAVGLSITMDGTPEEWENLESMLNKYIGTARFTSMVSLRIKESEKFAKLNCFFKIDDIGFSRSTSGVYVTPAKGIFCDSVKTAWESYKQDLILARKKDLE